MGEVGQGWIFVYIFIARCTIHITKIGIQVNAKES